MSGPTNRNTIASAMTSVLQGIDGSGSYTYDLSGTGQVEQLDLAGPPVSRVRPYVAYYLGPRQDIRNGADESSRSQCLLSLRSRGLLPFAASGPERVAHPPAPKATSRSGTVSYRAFSMLGTVRPS